MAEYRLRSDHVESLEDGTMVEPGDTVDITGREDDARVKDLIESGQLLEIASKSKAKPQEGGKSE
jgi:hypothetical protein